MDLNLRPYQAAAVNCMVRAGAFLLEDSPGLGKTECTIAALEAAGGTALIVAPKKALIQVWSDRYAKYGRERPVLVRNESDMAGSGQVKIVNYERLLRLERIPAFDTVVLDEGHRIRNRSTAIALKVKSLRSQRRWALTATPVVNNLGDLYSLFEFLAPKLLGRYRDFAAEHLIFKELRLYGGRTIKIISGARNVEGLNAKLDGHRLKRTHAMVNKDLPALDTIDLRVELSEKEQGLVRDLRKALREAFDGNPGQALATFTALRQAVSLPEVLGESATDEVALIWKGNRFAESSKLEELQELLAGDKRPVLIFTEFRRIAQRLHRELGGGLIVGGGKTEEAAARFQAGEDNILILNSAGTESLDLWRAEHVVNFDLPFTAAAMEQRIGRARRQHKITVHNLIAAGTVDERMLEIVTGKRELGEAVAVMALARAEAGL